MHPLTRQKLHGHLINAFLFGCALSLVGLLGTTLYVKSAGLSSANVQPATLVTGASGTATVSFTSIASVPADGKIKVTFPSGYNVSGASSGTCSTMDGSFAASVSGQTVTLTRQNDGTEQAPDAETCTLATIINPTVTGQTGVYSIETTNGTDVQIDIDAAVASDSITAAPLGSANVEPASLTASTTNVVTVTFTTQNVLEADGKIKVTFPSGYNVSGASGGTCSTMDGSFTTSVSGQAVTLTRSGGSPEPVGAQTCTINAIVNPATTGSTGTYAIQTLTAADAVHDSANSVSADVIIAANPALASTDVEPASLLTGVLGSVTVFFTTVTTIPPGGKVRITFPTGFDVSDASGGTCSSMDGTFVTSVSGQRVMITRQSDGTPQSAAAEVCTLENVRNPSISGTTGTYTIDTVNGSNTLLDIDSAVVGDIIAPSVLTATNVEPENLVAGALGTATISFTLVNALANDGKVQVTFPDAFTVSGASGGTCSSMDGSFATSVSGQTVTLTRSGGTSEPAGAQTCTLAGVVNPGVAGSTDTYSIRTATGANAVQDADTAVTADTLTPAALLATNVEPATLLAGASGTATISFTTVNLLESDGTIRVVFPTGFDVSGATSGTCSTMDGTFATSVTGQTVILTRSGGTPEPAGAQACTIATIVNPSIANTGGEYTITTTATGGRVHDTDTTVSADIFTPAFLPQGNIQPASYLVGINGYVNIYFTTTLALESDGKIKVTFPSGFDVSGATSGVCSTMDGSFATSVSGQMVIITRSGGALELAGDELCTVGGITNPLIGGASGTYTILTTNALNLVHERNTAIAGDIFSPPSHGSDGASSATRPSYAIRFNNKFTGQYQEGNLVPITWSTVGSNPATSFVTLSYSTDGGSFWTPIVMNTPDDGSFGWIAPKGGSANVIIKAETTDLSSILASTTSDTFVLGTPSGTVPLPEVSGDPQVLPEDTVVPPSTEEDTPSATPTTGSLVRGSTSRVVYFIENGLRRPFLDQQTFFTYATSFDDVMQVDDVILAQYPEGDPMAPKAGSVLVKIPTENYVYALDAMSGVLTLRWITSEAVASAIYGDHWTDYVVDILSSVWSHLAHGSDVTSPGDIEVQTPLYTRDQLNAK